MEENTYYKKTLPYVKPIGEIYMSFKNLSHIRVFIYKSNIMNILYSGVDTVGQINDVFYYLDHQTKTIMNRTFKYKKQL